MKKTMCILSSALIVSIIFFLPKTLLAEENSSLTGTTWYLAEGCTSGFDEYILIQNPNTSTANVTITFMKSDGATVVRTISIPKTSKYTIHVNDIVPDASLSTKIESDIGVIAERSMYWDSGILKRMGGHCSLGIAEPSTTWYLAEGYTGGSFDEWVLIQNPNSSTANVTVTFMKSDGTTVVRTINIPKTSRYTIYVNDIVPNDSVSTKIESDISVIAERAMYWDVAGLSAEVSTKEEVHWAGGHCSCGVIEPAITWYLAEGCTTGFDEYILIQNPNTSTANVTVTFIKSDGTAIVRNMAVPKTSRYTIYVNDIVPNNSVSTKVESTNGVGIIVERAMYWDVGGMHWAGGHCTCGVTVPATTWYLAEGYTGAGFDEYILIQNPNTSTANVTVTFMKNDGAAVVRTISIPKTSKYTIHVNDIVPNASLSTKIESDIGVIAERSMYWDSGILERIGGHCSIGNNLITVMSDTTPPQIEITSLVEDLHTNQTQIDISGTFTETNLNNITVNGIPAIIEDNTFIVEGIPLKEGNNTIIVIATDIFQNQSSYEINVIRDTIAPELEITYPEDGFITGESKITVLGTYTEANLERITVNGIEATCADGLFSVSGVPLSIIEDNIITAAATDIVQHSTEDSIIVARELTTEGVLQSVYDGSNLINDMTADMVVTSTFNGEPFGEPVYARYYYKQTNKIKTEFYEAQQRKSLTKIVINNDVMEYFISSVTGYISQENLAERVGMNQEQFRQMDINSNVEEFIENHTLTFIGRESAPSQSIYAVEAIPNIPNQLYSKLRLWVDLNKGLLIKSELYRGENLIETIETLETEEIVPGVWTETRMRKIPELESGEFITTMKHSNIQINQGLSDLVFDPENQ